jgi:sulfite exporter TauE/SafE
MTGTEATSALLLGLAGAGHCMGMCGGLALAFQAPENRRWSFPLTYHFGRLLGYASIGGFIGSVALFLPITHWTFYLRVVAALLLVAVGLHTLKLWYGITILERLGGGIWRGISPIITAFLPPKHEGHAMVMGALWGFMPCGLVYSALAWSAATASGPFDGAFLMGLFGIGTLPAMLGTTLAGQHANAVLRHSTFRNLMGITLIVMGSYSLWLTTPFSGHGTTHMHHRPQQKLTPSSQSNHHHPSSEESTSHDRH